MSLSCRKHSFIYQSLSISTVADPLSADLIKMSLRFLSDLRACRSREVKLSRTGSGFMLPDLSLITLTVTPKTSFT